MLQPQRLLMGCLRLRLSLVLFALLLLLPVLLLCDD
jgi:hypothetical protein